MSAALNNGSIYCIVLKGGAQGPRGGFLMDLFRSHLAELDKGGLARSIQNVLEASPEKILLSDENIGLSGAMIAERIEALSKYFQATLPEHARVGVFLPNSAAKATVVLALLSCKRTPVLLSVPDHEAHLEERIDRMKLQGWIVEQHHFERTPDFSLKIGLDASARIRGIRGGVKGNDAPPPPEGTALILYTSGSMGEPKGVCLSEAALLYNMDFLIRYQGLNANTRATMVLPICHTMALNTQFLPTFFAGGSSVFYDVVLSLGKVYRVLLESEGTCVALISHLVRLCHEERLRKSLPAAPLVRQVTLAGGVIRSHHLEMCEELFPNAVIYKGYGLTEAIRVSMISSREEGFYENTAGNVLPQQTIEIRDDEGHVLPQGEIGHIFVKGPNVMLGYDFSGASAAESVVQDGFLSTHDMGCLSEEGQLVIHGRSDGIVKVLGKKVSLKSIEDATIQSLENVSDVKCIAVPSERSDQTLALFVEAGSRPLTPSLLFDFESQLKNRIKSLHAVPKDVFFLSSFTRTQNGKIKISSLRDLYHRRHLLRRIGLNSDPHRMSFYSDAWEPQRPYGPLDPLGMGHVQQMG